VYPKATSSGGECPGVRDDLPCVGFERRGERLAKGNRFPRDDVHQRSALDARDDHGVDQLGHAFVRPDFCQTRPKGLSKS